MRLSIIALAISAIYPNTGPVSLFANGEQGAWYDPSDFRTMFQDAGGATPVTAVEQPVGLLLDKSRGLVLGSELAVNGEFDSTAGWTAGAGWTISGDGAARATAAAGGISQPAVGMIAGRTYEFTVVISTVVAGSVRFSSGGAGYTGPLITTAGTHKCVLTPTSGGLISFGSLTAFTGVVESISVRELPGNHAYQTTSTSRPVLSARVNLLAKTEQFDDAVWTKAATTVVVNAAVAPNGTTTADKLVEDVSTNVHRVRQTAGAVTGVFSIYAKAGELSSLWVGTSDIAIVAVFDLASATVTSGAGTITDVGGGWYRCVAASAAYSASGPYCGLYKGGTSYTGDGTSGIYIWGASLVPANQAALPYQRVNTSTDYDTAGFPLYLRFDGVDDFLVTNSINFTATDKMTVFAGVRKLSDAATGIVAELSANSTGGANAGAFNLRAPEGAAATYSAWSAGTIPVQAVSSATYPAPDTKVLTMVGAIGDDVAALRANGAQIASTNFNQGTGNYGNYPLYIGRRGGTSSPFNGYIYSLIVRGAQSNAGQIGNTEQWVNGKTKAY